MKNDPADNASRLPTDSEHYGIVVLSVGNIAASEDAAQEAFLIAWRKIHELREPEQLRAWPRQIARRASLPGSGLVRIRVT